MANPTQLDSVHCVNCHGEFVEVIPRKAQRPQDLEAPQVQTNQNFIPQHNQTQSIPRVNIQEERRSQPIHFDFVYIFGPMNFFGLFDPQEQSTAHPTSKAAIAKLERVKVTSSMINEGNACAVCCNDFKEGDDAHKLPCKHMFHPGCIKPWLETHNTCPVCRKELPTEQI